MTDSLLTLNAGSSSIKVALFDAAHPGGADDALPSARWSGQADGLGAGLKARLRVRDAQGKTLLDEALDGSHASHASHQGALAALLEWHAQQGEGSRIAAVGHRIVHGGTDFVAPVRIDAALLDALARLEPLAPLHQPHNLAGVRAAMAAFEGVPQVACFDTAFHAVQPEVNRRFALPRELHDAGVRRYGFHGLSYESIVAQFGGIAPELAQRRVIVAHLGNGASMCGMRHGRSVATTMTFSPLDGLTMGTRCGHIDAAVVLYLMRSRGMSADAVEKLLFRESGLLGISGVSSDMRALEASAEPAAAQASGISSSRWCSTWAAWRPRCAVSTPSSSRAASARTRSRCANASWPIANGWACAPTRPPTAKAPRASPRPTAPSVRGCCAPMKSR